MPNFKTDHLSNFIPNIAPQSNDNRLGHDLVNPKEHDWVLLGYPDDEGIKNNGGRPGSAEGPKGFRQIFYKMTPHLLKMQSSIKDLGDLSVSESLSDRHHVLREKLSQLHADGKNIISIGGGHDYGYPDGAAFCEHYIKQGERPFVINFDAHLDVRPFEEKITSGTPFFRLLEEFGHKIDFVEVGIQPQCNSKRHLEWALSKGAMVYHLEEIKVAGLEKIVSNLCRQFEGRPTFISIDIDAFEAASAPGCSQSWPTGIDVNDFLKALTLMKRQLDVKHFGIYELSPPLDNSLITQRLAAQIVFEFITWESEEL